MIFDQFIKIKLLRWFTLRYILLDNIYHTLEMGATDKIILVNNSYIVPGHEPDFDIDEPFYSRKVKAMSVASSVKMKRETEIVRKK